MLITQTSRSNVPKPQKQRSRNYEVGAKAIRRKRSKFLLIELHYSWIRRSLPVSSPALALCLSQLAPLPFDRERMGDTAGLKVAPKSVTG